MLSIDSLAKSCEKSRPESLATAVAVAEAVSETAGEEEVEVGEEVVGGEEEEDSTDDFCWSWLRDAMSAVYVRPDVKTDVVKMF